MPSTTMMSAVKLALRLTTDAFDTEISDLIDAAYDDLRLCGIIIESASEEDPLVKRAVVTYCRAHFGQPEDGFYDRLKKAYDEQKAQLQGSQVWTEVTS